MEKKAVPVAFISGHLDLTESQFAEHYIPKIKAALEANHQFVMGSARGADTMALNYLLQHCSDKKRITVYVYSRNVKSQDATIRKLSKFGVNVMSDFKSDSDRDAACTRASTYDIAWVRPKEETAKLLGAKYDPNRLSGTEQNLLRRTQMS